MKIPTISLAAAMFAAGCTHGSSARVRGEPLVVLHTAAGEQTVKVELARNDAERARGLMFRNRLESGRGMLFLFDQPEPLSFWMKNTYIPLDMIFLDGARRVVYIEESAEPLTLTPRGPKVDAQFVLEVPGGWSRPHGVEPGVTVTFSDID